MSLKVNGRYSAIKRGATRDVLLLGELAIKIPSLRSWRGFLRGMLANAQEKDFSATRWPELCPVIASLPLGLAIVMPRAEEVETMSGEEYVRLVLEARNQNREIPVEAKLNSFGKLDGRIVVVDYGS